MSDLVSLWRCFRVKVVSSVVPANVWPPSEENLSSGVRSMVASEWKNSINRAVILGLWGKILAAEYGLLVGGLEPTTEGARRLESVLPSLSGRTLSVGGA